MHVTGEVFITVLDDLLQRCHRLSILLWNKVFRLEVALVILFVDGGATTGLVFFIDRVAFVFMASTGRIAFFGGLIIALACTILALGAGSCSCLLLLLRHSTTTV